MTAEWTPPAEADWGSDPAHQVVIRWNRDHAVGAPVLFWPGGRDYEDGRFSTTRSEAKLFNGTPGVMVNDYAGFIALTHVAALAAARGPLVAEVDAKIKAVLAEFGHDMRQQAEARDRMRRTDQATSERMDQGRWAFYEAARILCSHTDRPFGVWLDENGYEQTRIARGADQ